MIKIDYHNLKRKLTKADNCLFTIKKVRREYLSFCHLEYSFVGLHAFVKSSTIIINIHKFITVIDYNKHLMSGLIMASLR